MVNYTIPDFLLTTKYNPENISPNSDLFTQNNESRKPIPTLGLDNIVTWNSDVFQDINTRINDINSDKIGVDGESGQLLGFVDTNVLAALNLQDLITSQGPLIMDGSNFVTNTIPGRALRTNSIPDGILGPLSVSLANMQEDSVGEDQYIDGSIHTDALADLNVTESKIASRAVTSSKIGLSDVLTEHINNGAVTSSKIGINSVLTEHINNGAVTLEKLAAALAVFLVPIGTIHAYGGVAAPEGFLLCDGSEVSRITYAALFNVIGISYGNGDGNSTFNLPDRRGRFSAGFVNGSAAGRITIASALQIGGTGGRETTTLTPQNLPNFSLEYIRTDPSNINVGTDGVSNTRPFTVTQSQQQTSSIGNDVPFNQMNPFVFDNYIIKY